MKAAQQRTLALALQRAQQAGAACADALLVQSAEAQVRVRGAQVEHVQQARRQCLGLRVFTRARGALQSAVVGSSDLAEDAIARLAEDAAALARATAPDPCAGLPDAAADSDSDSAAALQLCDVPEEAGGDSAGADIPALTEAARRAEAAARAESARITNSEGADAGAEFTQVAYANSRGQNCAYAHSGYSLMCAPIAQQGAEMQADYWAAAARHRAQLQAPEEVGRRAARRALRRLGAKPVATCEAPVVFEAPAARSLLGNLAACINGGAVYRGGSFLAGRLGETVAAPVLNVTDDGRLPRGLGSRPFDGEGLPTRRTPVIQNGVLQNYLLDSYAARKLELASTGNAARAAASAPHAAPTNLWIQPGEQSLEELIAGVERGLLVTELFGHGFNPVTGDLSRGATGVWIEGGAPAHAVCEITVAGKMGELLQNIDGVGRDLLRQGAVAAPSLRVARMSIAGK